MTKSTPTSRTEVVSMTLKVSKEVKNLLQKYADADLRSVSNWLTIHIMALEQSKRATTVVKTTTTDGETTTTDTPWESNW
jgi:hypothetical protein